MRQERRGEGAEEGAEEGADEGEDEGEDEDMKLADLVTYLDDFLGIAEVDDYGGAFNGLQVARRGGDGLGKDGQGGVDAGAGAGDLGEVRRVSLAVDACQHTLEAAVAAGTELLLVHHGLFWGPRVPFVGPAYKRLATAIRGNLAIYSCHLPLDAHPEVGNNVEIVRALGFDPSQAERFGDFHGIQIGYVVSCDLDRAAWHALVDKAVGVHSRLIATGPERIRRFAVVSGGAASSLGEAVAAGCDALLTGEGSHPDFFVAEEHGVSLCLAGHYATERFGVRALGRHLAERFGLETSFIEHETGL